jgi:quercetin dioxygenase-like cupin family protein
LGLRSRFVDPRPSPSNEEVWYVIDGTLDLTVDGVTHRAGPGSAAIILPDTPHEVLAITDGRALVVNHPVRSDEPSS